MAARTTSEGERTIEKALATNTGIRRILVTGDRWWDDFVLIQLALAELPQDAVIIQGLARGADLLAAEAALNFGLTLDGPDAFLLDDGRIVHGWAANWGAHGRAAGPVRNDKMLRESRPTEIWAFHDALWSTSKGTRDMVTKAMKEGLPVRLFSHASVLNLPS